jgi:hypothetical protein
MKKPSPDADPRYIVGEAKDYTTQSYASSMINSGAMFDSGGPESLDDFQKRGQFIQLGRKMALMRVRDALSIKVLKLVQ